MTIVNGLNSESMKLKKEKQCIQPEKNPEGEVLSMAEVLEA
jgi:hypothetical protein